MATTTVSESVYIFRIMLKAGAPAGVDPDIAREAIHLDQATLDDPDARIPMDREVALWKVLAERSGDDCFGLHAADFTFASVYAIGLGITGEHWVPKRVCFQHAEPADISPYHVVFPCKLNFNCERNRLEFDSAVLDLPVVGGDPALNSVLMRHADELLLKLPASDDVLDLVRTELASCLRDGDPTIEQIADRLHMTPRTLQRRLKEAGSTYKALVDTMRKGLADRYLWESQFGVSEIAYLLGYSEPSAFHRAFKRWFGQSPAGFRKSCQSI